VRIMLKTIALSITICLPSVTMAGVEPIQNASPNGNAITPTTVAASTVTITGTGSKCFSVDDPTLVVDCNLNRVGVGIAAPVSNLEVFSAPAAYTTMQDIFSLRTISSDFGVPSQMSFGVAGASEQYCIGINEVGCTTNALGTAASATRSKANWFFDPTSSAGSYTATDLEVSDQVGTKQLQILGSDNSGNVSILNSTFTVKAAGNVGIGTASPATTLDVNGNAQFGSGATKSTFTATGFWEPISKTKAQVDTLVPTKVGQVIYASDTTLPGLCISTGTSAAQWRKMESATLGCGTNN